MKRRQRRASGIAGLLSALLVFAALPAIAGPQPAVSSPSADLLRRAAQYVGEYEQKFDNLAAEESWTQWARMADPRARGGRGAVGLRQGTTTKSVAGAVTDVAIAAVCFGSARPDGFGPAWCRRMTKADIVFVRLPGTVQWGTFRDVYEVEGSPVRRHEPRLEQLFASMEPAAAVPRARGLLEDGDARYNIGPALRAIDSPTFAVTFLRAENQGRFSWKPGGTRRVGDVAAVEVAFEEVARPTIARRDDGQDLPARGRIWLDPAQGTVVRCETEFRFESPRGRASVAVEFRPEPKLALWVPVELKEEYQDEGDNTTAMFGGGAKATAQYSNFRRIGGTSATAGVTPAGSDVAPAGTANAAPSYDAELTEVLRRVGEYVTDYERSFGNLVVEETYTQETVAPLRTKFDETGRAVVTACSNCKRSTRADLVFVRLAGEFPWASYRDVFEVDGQKIRDHEQRLVRLFSNPRPDAHDQARQLLKASAEYNIGPVTRTVNLPTLPLVFLLPTNQGRFRFELGDRRTVSSTEAVELRFQETSRPTLVSGPRSTDLPASGRFWVNSRRGTVLRSETAFDFGPESEARVSTDYRADPALAMWVPAEMREQFADVAGATVRTFPRPFKSVARYGRFRRFTVETDEQATVPPQP